MSCGEFLADAEKAGCGIEALEGEAMYLEKRPTEFLFDVKELIST